MSDDISNYSWYTSLLETKIDTDLDLALFMVQNHITFDILDYEPEHKKQIMQEYVNYLVKSHGIKRS